MRSLTTGDDVRVSRKTRAKEDRHLLHSPRRTALTLLSQVGTAVCLGFAFVRDQ